MASICFIPPFTFGARWSQRVIMENFLPPSLLLLGLVMSSSLSSPLASVTAMAALHLRPRVFGRQQVPGVLLDPWAEELLQAAVHHQPGSHRPRHSREGGRWVAGLPADVDGNVLLEDVDLQLPV